jgi:hypothetical protein
MTWPDDLASAGSGSKPTLRRFTLHIDFMAADEHQAHRQTEAYAQGLGQLRSEIDTYTARVSVEGNWSMSTPAFCGAPGPDPNDVCVDSAGHPGLHHGPGATGQWSEDATPTAPDGAEDLG